MIKQLEVTFGKTFDGKPLAVVHNLPGQDAEMTPQQMRALAQALLDASKDCETHDLRPRYYRRIQRSYQLTEIC